jgi:hypothetical protein
VRTQDEALQVVYERAGRMQRRRRLARVATGAVVVVVALGMTVGIVQRRSAPSTLLEAGNPAATAPTTATTTAGGTAAVTEVGTPSTVADASLPPCGSQDVVADAVWQSDTTQPAGGVFDVQPTIDSVIDHDCLMRFAPVTVSVTNAAGFEYFHYVEPRVLVSLRAQARAHFFYGNVWFDTSCSDRRSETTLCYRPPPGEYTMTIDYFGFRRALPFTIT